MNRRAFFLALLAPFLNRLRRMLPQRSYTTPWMDMPPGNSVMRTELWILDRETGEYRPWPDHPSPYWHGRVPFVVLDLDGRGGTIEMEEWSKSA